MPKPRPPYPRGVRGEAVRLARQPGQTIRGQECLRIIYGPEYTLLEHLERLRKRGVTGKAIARPSGVCPRRRSARAVRPPGAVSPCPRVRDGVLALESEPVDPRLHEQGSPNADLRPAGSDHSHELGWRCTESQAEHHGRADESDPLAVGP